MAGNSFNYSDIRFADIQMLRYRLHGFDGLSLRQKQYVYCLSQATLYGRDITFDQFGKYNLKIRKTLEAIYTDGAIDHGDKEFAARLISVGRERCLSSYARYFAGATRRQLEFYYAFVSAGCIGLLERWLAEGMTVPAEEMAAMAEGVMMKGIGFLEEK